VKSVDRLFIPDKSYLPLSTEDLNQWYFNLIPEIEKANYSSDEVSLLKDKRNYYGKFFSEDTREFFLNHFGRNLAQAINYLFGNYKLPMRFLEIGSGCGNQLLLMAFLAAEVVGCDIREDVCDLVEKRKGFYEEISEYELDISVICDDVFRVDWDEFLQFDAVNFLFSFNDVARSHRLLKLVSRVIKPGGRLVIQDTNPSNYYNRIFRRRNALVPRQVTKALELRRFKIHSLRGGYAVPPVFWRILPISIVASIDRTLCKSIFMSPSYQLMAEKMGSREQGARSRERGAPR